MGKPGSPKGNHTKEKYVPTGKPRGRRAGVRGDSQIDFIKNPSPLL